MPDMFWTVILIIFAPAAMLAVALVCAPIRISAAHSSRAGEVYPARVVVSFGHALFLRVEYCFESTGVRLFIFGRRFFAPRQTPEQIPARGPLEGAAADEVEKEAQTPESGVSMADEEGAEAEYGAGDEGVGAEEEKAGAVEVETRVRSAEAEEPVAEHRPEIAQKRVDEAQREPFEPPRDDAAALSPPPPVSEQPAAGDSEAQPPGAKKSWRRKIEENKYVFILRQKRLRRGVLRSMKHTLHCLLRLVAFDKLELRVAGSTGEPVVTGITYGALSAVRHGLQPSSRRRAVLEFEPSFDQQASLTWDGAVAIRTSIGRLICPAVVLVATFPYLSVFLTWRRMKKRGMI